MSALVETQPGQVDAGGRDQGRYSAAMIRPLGS
jgi:hypothetical protein